MKRKFTLLLAAVCCMACCGVTALAANQVPELEIDVALRQDGSACITQIWSADTDEGTEFYLACHDSGYLTITDFSVSDRSGEYTLIEDWDVDASFEEKAGKCGFLETEKGVELCWGISAYGENRYTISYVLHDLVGRYTDADGFNHRFVDEMSFFPTQVSLTIRCEDGTPLTDAGCDIWGFGFAGQVAFEDGMLRAWSEEPLESGQHMTVMVALEQGILAPRRAVEDSFETVKERAFDGSDYDDGEGASLGDFLLVAGILAGIVAAIVVIALVAVRVQRAKLNKRMRQTQYFRDAPNGGNLNVSHRLGLCSDLCEEDALLGAYLLRLISQGCLEQVDAPLDEEAVSLRLSHAPRSGNEFDDALYTILEAAAAGDGVLQPRELERFCEQSETPLLRFMDSCQRNGLQTLIRGGCMKGANLDNMGDLSRRGQEQLDELLGLKRYLLDFSLIRERGVKETVIWQDYMVYALLLGIADQLAPQIRELYPEDIPQLEQYQRYIHCTGYYNGVMYGAYRRQQQRMEMARSGGSGGRASFGGGGGFSGGGGGGVR